MPSLFVIGHLKTTGGEARQTVIDTLTTVSKYSLSEEPGVYKFCIALPRKDDDGTSVFAIEEYADHSAMDKHMASPAVAELLKIFSSDPKLFSAEPAIYGLPTKLSAGPSFTRSSLLPSTTPDPLIIFANFGYKPSTTSRALPGWTSLVEYAKEKEEGTLTYTVLEDKEKGWIRTVEAYAGEEFLEDVHVKSTAIAENQKQNAEWRTGEKEVWRLKAIAGYLHKEGERAWVCP